MNYYYDTEFLEGTQKKWFGNTKPTIDLISIGIVAEDGREYYAISKDFNLKEAWNRYDLEIQSGDMRNRYPEGKKVYWIRENVLRPIWVDLIREHNNKENRLGLTISHKDESKFNYKTFKYLLIAYGKSNNKIAQEVFEFNSEDTLTLEKAKHYNVSYENIKVYGYYSAYDHVALCWLFGKMIDLPKGFPMYTIDLKQLMDEKISKDNLEINGVKIPNYNLDEKIQTIKNITDYPKQTNEHNALADAKWNKDLHNFLNKL